MSGHYHDTHVGSPLENYMDVGQPQSARHRAESTFSNNYYDVAGYNVVEDGGGYYDVALPAPRRNRHQPPQASGQAGALLPYNETKRVIGRLSKELRHGLMNQLLNGMIVDDQGAMVPDYERGMHVYVRGSHIRRELTENYYDEIKDLINPDQSYPQQQRHDARYPGPSSPPHRHQQQQQQPRRESPGREAPRRESPGREAPRNGQSGDRSPRPPTRGDSMWTTEADRRATPTTPTPSRHAIDVQLPERRITQHTPCYKRAWDWIYEHPKISVPIILGAIFLIIVVIVVIAVVFTHKSDSSTTTTTTTTAHPPQYAAF